MAESPPLCTRGDVLRDCCAVRPSAVVDSGHWWLVNIGHASNVMHTTAPNPHFHCAHVCVDPILLPKSLVTCAWKVAMVEFRVQSFAAYARAYHWCAAKCARHQCSGFLSPIAYRCSTNVQAAHKESTRPTVGHSGPGDSRHGLALLQGDRKRPRRCPSKGRTSRPSKLTLVDILPPGAPLPRPRRWLPQCAPERPVGSSR